MGSVYKRATAPYYQKMYAHQTRTSLQNSFAQSTQVKEQSVQDTHIIDNTHTMLFNVLLPLALLLASQPLTQPQACTLHPRQASPSNNSTIAYPWAQPGDDRPSSPATTGYFINHLCINVRNVTKSIDWYNRAFGLRLLFTVQVSEHFSISYMGHAHGGRNGTGFQTSTEMNREKNNREGLLELLNLDFPGWDLPSGSKVPNTFSRDVLNGVQP